MCTTIIAKLKPGADAEAIGKALHHAYDSAPFVRLTGKTPADTKHVTRTNFVDIGWTIDERTGRVVLMSAQDNVVKGAGGQGVQSFNIMFGFSQTEGLLMI